MPRHLKIILRTTHLPQRFPNRHGASHGHVDRPHPGAHRDAQPRFGSFMHQPLDAVPVLPRGATSTVTIGPDGYAEWRAVGTDSTPVGVDIATTGAWRIYDSAFKSVANGKGNSQAFLPAASGFAAPSRALKLTHHGSGASERRHFLDATACEARPRAPGPSEAHSPYQYRESPRAQRAPRENQSAELGRRTRAPGCAGSLAGPARLRRAEWRP